MPTVNQRIGEYVLDSRVGVGTFGEVWRAHHHVWIDQLAAVKIPTDPSYVLNLQKEGINVHTLLQASAHPNIVRAIGFDPYADPPYLTMEFVPGTSLRPLIQQRKLSPMQGVAVLRQVLAGLEHAHRNGVIHRDVKPENILVHERAFTDGFDAEGVIKVTDFGLGKAAAATAATSIAYSASINNANGKNLANIAGTLDYMAPEQRSGGEIDARADLYACGVILYEILTGERPAGTEVPSDLNPASPKYLDEIFRRSYARLDKRYHSAAEFASALQPRVTPPPPPLTMGGHAGTYAPGMHKPPMPPPAHLAPPHPPPGATLAGGPHGDNRTCPSCKQSVGPSDQFCMHCGVQLTATIRRCPKCGAYPDLTDQYCMFCGETLAPQMARA